MNFLYPKFPIKHLPVMLRTALLGAVVAGCYGALHDQVSYTISPEYFTKMKFRQFSYLDLGLPPRLFASEVGFMASWWVGLATGWLLARAGLAELPLAVRRRCIARSFAIAFLTAVLIGSLGALVGFFATSGGDIKEWRNLRATLGVGNGRAFVIVGYLHAASYLGALVGLMLAIVNVRKCVSRIRSSKKDVVDGANEAATEPLEVTDHSPLTTHHSPA
ncbi:MAG TPA: hypothetical protein VGZ47_05210 [Gemmataceae bacterium]|jgi:hypothetical protein|nr:hypothetical protein [Gemmataceae bacterium]